MEIDPNTLTDTIYKIDSKQNIVYSTANFIYCSGVTFMKKVQKEADVCICRADSLAVQWKLTQQCKATIFQ